MHDDTQLLRRFVEYADQDAFRSLVDRHSGMVYGVALRHSGIPEMAEDVTQIVFLQLARKAAALKNPERLPGWLHRSALLESAHQLRKGRLESQRRARLAESIGLQTAQQHTPMPNELAALVDEAINELSPKDRDLILDKYYEGLTYREIAAKHTGEEATARKQGSRALEKLERLLTRKGVTVSGSTLSLSLPSAFAVHAPVGLPEVIEGRVADLLDGHEMAATTSILATLFSTPITTALVALTACSLPLSLDWGRRLNENSAMSGSIGREPVSLVASRIQTDPMANTILPPPSLEDVVGASGARQLALLVRWLPHAIEDELRQLGEAMRPALRRRLLDSNAEVFWGLYMERWMQISPENALAYARELRRDSMFGHDDTLLAAEKLYALWAQSDPQEAFAATKAKSNSLAMAVIHRLQEIDPQAALKQVESMTPEASAFVDWKSLFTHLAKTDPEGALVRALKLENPLGKADAIDGVLEHLSALNPVHALTLAKQHGASSDTVEAIYTRWLARDLDQVTAHLETLTPSLERNRLAQRLVQAMAQSDPEGAEAWANAQESSPVRNAALAGLAIHYAGRDPDRALEMFEALDWKTDLIDRPEVYRSDSVSGHSTDGTSLEKAAKTAILTLASTDREKALAVLRQFEDFKAIQAVTGEIADTWMHADAAGLRQFIENSEDSRIRALLAYQFANQTLEPEAALQWGKQLGGDAGKTAISHAITEMSYTDSERAFGSVQELNDFPPALQVELFNRISRSMITEEQLDEAEAWLEQQDDTTAFAESYKALTCQRAERDIATASHNVDGLPPGPIRQQAIQGLITYLARQPSLDHQAMLHWINQAETSQARWFEQLAESWLAADPATAMAVLPKTEIPTDTWRNLLSRHQHNTHN